MNTSTDNNNNTPSCANCGKGEDSIDSLKACTACKLVKYCNRECQIAHRKQHKKECRLRAAKLHDEALFKDPPPPKDCPICFLPTPRSSVNSTFKSCCGKVICSGCIIAMLDDADARGKPGLCAFCRKVVAASYEEELRRTEKLIEANNAAAYNALGDYYSRGHLGLPRDMKKANELFLKGGELGCADAYLGLGISYDRGLGVDIDKKKAKYYWELAAIGGNETARHNVGNQRSTTLTIIIEHANTLFWQQRVGTSDRWISAYMGTRKDLLPKTNMQTRYELINSDMMR